MRVKWVVRHCSLLCLQFSRLISLICINVYNAEYKDELNHGDNIKILEFLPEFQGTYLDKDEVLLFAEFAK